MTRQIIEGLRRTDGGAELIARLSHHMQCKDSIARTKEAQLFVGHYATENFNGNLVAMVEDYRTNGLFNSIIFAYGRKQFGI